MVKINKWTKITKQDFLQNQDNNMFRTYNKGHHAK